MPCAKDRFDAGLSEIGYIEKWYFAHETKVRDGGTRLLVGVLGQFAQRK